MRTSILALLLFSSYRIYGQVPEPSPGLPVPGGSLPYAFDHFEGKPQLVPVHHSAIEINNHKGANVAGSLAGSVFYKPKMTFEVSGEHARTTLHDPKPSFYVHTLEDTDGAPDDGPVFAIVHATLSKGNRVFAQVRFTQLTGNAKRNDGTVEIGVAHLPGGWVKIIPKEPLPPGEYALTPIPKEQNAFSTVVFDFAENPQGPNDADAVRPSETPNE